MRRLRLRTRGALVGERRAGSRRLPVTQGALSGSRRLRTTQGALPRRRHAILGRRRLSAAQGAPAAARAAALAAVFGAALTAAGGLSALPLGDTAPLGPLGGRNLYAPHLPWFSFPAERAASLDEGTIVLRSSLSFLNEFASYPVDMAVDDDDSDGKVDDQDGLTALDYESTVWEIGADWQAFPDWRFSADWRFHVRYPGFGDTLIEGFHGIFDLSNAGREYFDRNRSYWNILSANSRDYTGSGVVAGSGDLDLRVVWTFLERPGADLALCGAFKLPTGRCDAGYGSGYPDAGLALLADWRLRPRWAFYATFGMIQPLGPEGRFMIQFAPAVEFRMGRDWSILVQGNIQRSPLVGTELYSHSLFGVQTMFTLPQTDLKIGVKGRSGRFAWQVYFEEDPFTWEGPDLVFFLGGKWTLETHRRGD